MSDDWGRDYNRGLSGQGGADSTNFEAHQAGAAARQDLADQQARIDGSGRSSASAWGSQPKVAVSPLGCAAILVAPALFVLYPLAGLIVGAGFLGGVALGELLFSDNVRIAQLLLGLVPMLALVPVGMRVESYANRFMPYRWLRWPLRLGVLGSWLVLMILTNGQLVTGIELETAWNNASPRQVFYCFAALPIVALFALFLDHFVLPGMGVAPQRLARMAEKGARAEQAAHTASDAKPARVPYHITAPIVFGYVGVAIAMAYATPFNLGETAVIAFALFWAVMGYRRRRSAPSADAD